MGRQGTATGEEALARALGEHADRFSARFGNGAAPRTFFAPGRVNLMGAHLDYNGGPVMPTAIDRGTFLALRRTGDGCVRLATTHEDTVAEWSGERLPSERTGTWVDYPLGVLRELQASFGGPFGVEILYGGNLPIAAGLSSSASICVGTAWALDAIHELALDRLELARVALRAERGFVGVQCGIMDPYAIGLARRGHLLMLDCKDESFEHVPLDSGAYVIAIADTGVRRELAQSEFNRRVDECRRAYEGLGPHADGATCLRDVPRTVLEAHGHELDPPVRRRATHVVSEVERTLRARAALLAGDVPGFGARMFEAQDSLRDAYEVSVPELDCLVDAGRDCEAVLGARLTGAGFGGCAVFLLRAGGEAALEEAVRTRFVERFDREPEVAFFGADAGPREV